MSQNKKAPRRLERVFAFKVLYGLCFGPADSVEALSRAFALAPERPEGLAEDDKDSFAWELAHGVWSHQAALDTRIGALSENWRVERMGKVELTLLRLALFELTFLHDMPPKVAINEAIELSKQFGDDKSRSFVNGILDAASKALESGTLKHTPGTTKGTTE